MKAKIAIFVLLSSATWVSAGSTVPKLMSYQGRVTDSSGTAIGNTAPVNRAVTFRLYSVSTGGTASYNETQTVTISGGEFSVLIGNGTGLTGLPGPTTPASPIKTIDSIVNTATTSTLYLGITVDDGSAATVDTEISPRQQLVTGTYALRALMAETVATGAVTSTMLGDGAVTTNQVAAGAITSAKIADASIAAADIAGSAITAAKIDTTTIGLWTPSGTSIYRNSNVGIGVTNPDAVLQLAAKTGTTTPATNGLRVFNSNSTIADNAVLAAAVAGPNSGSPYVSLDISGTQGWSIGVENTDSDKLVFKNSWDFAANPKMAIDVAGNVGIGTTSPTEKLTVSGGSLRVFRDSNPYVVVSTSANQGIFGIATSAGSWSTASAANDVILKSDSSKVILQSGGGAAAIVIDTANKVGIGTSTPVAKLAISETTGTVAGANSGGIIVDHENTGGASSIVFRSKFNRGGDYGYIQYQDDASIGGGGESARLIIGTSNDTDDNIILAPSGKVGIGTNTPLAPLHVAGSGRSSFSLQFYMDASAVVDKNETRADLDHSIIADYRVRAAAFDVSSDRRIKDIIGISKGAEDLAVLQSIEITDYTFKDQLAMGKQPQKRVIAQQVEAVYPNAVKMSSGVVPDIFKKAVIAEGWVKLATNLKVGERVRLFNRDEDAVQEVLEVRVGAFRTAFKPKDPKIFVYGREVSDFRSVDYDAIAMLNVSATQQLKKEKDTEVQALRALVAALEARLSALEKPASATK